MTDRASASTTDSKSSLATSISSAFSSASATAKSPIAAAATTTHFSNPHSPSSNTSTPYSTPPSHPQPFHNHSKSQTKFRMASEQMKARHPSSSTSLSSHNRQPSMNRKLSQVSSNSGVSRSQSQSQSAKESSSSRQSELWTTFHQFSSNTKASDSLIYALTRKEAWMQYNKANVPGKNMDIIELWTIMSLRFVLKNRLLFSPQSKQLHQGNKRVLDIHGVFKAPWGWQVAMDYPNANVFGYQFDHAGLGNQLRDGPSNYITIIGDSLLALPFEDNFFDVVTCKSLWYFLQVGQWQDVLKEIFRVLKPGGAVELVVCDYDVLNRGATDEYWWNRLLDGVSKRNIDPYPSASTPQRLNAAGFDDLHRAMLCLPRGWPGQMGHMTDFMSMYYSDSMFSYFANLSADEMNLFRQQIGKAEAEDLSANTVTLCYGTKPLT